LIIIILKLKLLKSILVLYKLNNNTVSNNELGQYFGFEFECLKS